MSTFSMGFGIGIGIYTCAAVQEKAQKVFVECRMVKAGIIKQ